MRLSESCQGVVDRLLGHGSGDAGEEEEEGFESEMRADGLVRCFVAGWGMAMEGCDEAVESLGLDVFERGEEDAVPQGVFAEGEAEIGEDAAEAE